MTHPTDTSIDSLMAPASRDRGTGWVRQHNRAVDAFVRERIGATAELKRSERAILSLIAGLDQWAGSTVPEPWAAEHVVEPALVAIGNALNLDLGRLDGGMLSEWCERMRARVGIDEAGHAIRDNA